MKRTNAWHAAIIAQLRAAATACTVDQIWQGMQAAGFQHASASPRQTLSARIAELVQQKVLERVEPAIYQLPVLNATQFAPKAGQSLHSISETQQEARLHAEVVAKLGAP